MQPVGMSSLILQLVIQLPILIACLVGIGLAAANRSRYPAPSLLALIASSLNLLALVVVAFFQAYLFPEMRDKGMSINEVRTMSLIIALARNTIEGGAIILLLVAILVGRKKGRGELT